MTEQKYRGSMEQIGKVLWHYSSTPLLDAVRLFDLTVFSFLTANSDMHLKNFSLLYGRAGRIRLAPAYDLLATQVLLPSDKEETALSVNGRKASLAKRDFQAFAEYLRLSPKQVENAYARWRGSLTKLKAVLAGSLALDVHKEELAHCIAERADRLEL